ncbi:MAG: hypothetical protein IJ122_09510 [Methanobrevibacter sp.]|nr:hypothetical protein [Methanobrevibacter sp.]
MTAQSLILTKDVVVVGSDLAITTPDNKSYTTGKKIFSPDSNYPVAVMINGYIDFEDISLETLIGEFAKNTNFNNVKTIKEIKNSFIDYLQKNTQYTSSDEYLRWILDSFKENIAEEINEYGFKDVISYKKRKELLPFIEEYENFDREFFDIITEADKRKYNQILWEIFSYELSFEGSGIIFAGFDEKHYYPSFFEINIFCNDNGKLIYEEVDSKENSRDPIIKVFAINEEAYTFITGVSSEFENELIEFIEESNVNIMNNINWYLKNEKFDEKTIEKLREMIELFIDDENTELTKNILNFKLKTLNSTTKALKYLPIPIICNLADYLIKLTALKQKLSSELETVSSETDIAIVTKVDNFKWKNHGSI